MTDASPLRILFALPGLHRVNRGAEIVIERLGQELATGPGCDVTLIGSGWPQASRAYRFEHAGCTDRARFLRWPRVPLLRSEYAWEELTFVPGLLRRYRPARYDVTVTCSYPYTNWVLRSRGPRDRRPAHVFVTENGDWPARTTNAEFKWFSCDGLVCTNSEYFERHEDRWRCALIPNGVDVEQFAPGPGDRGVLGLSERPVVLMVGAVNESKRTLEALEALATLDGVDLLLAGDGPLAARVDEEGRRRLGDRYHRVVVPPQDMPGLYRAADVLLHMSLDEPFGNIYLEALATGLPVVADDNPRSRWILEDQAELVDSKDPSAVAAGLERAFQDRQGPAAQARRELAERRYAWPLVARQYLDFFRQVVAARDP